MDHMNTRESGDVTLARAAFAEALRVQMARMGINKRDLAYLTRRSGQAGISEGTIGKYYRAEQTPRWTEQVQLAAALDITVVDLIANAVAVYERLKSEDTP
jgi:hypothetical protein